MGGGLSLGPSLVKPHVRVCVGPGQGGAQSHLAYILRALVLTQHFLPALRGSLSLTGEESNLGSDSRQLVLCGADLGPTGVPVQAGGGAGRGFSAEEFCSELVVIV